MSETLKFGKGIWATKVGSTLAYNDEGGNFKPLPFSFTRSTSATRVNKDGLIEVVTNNKPRIDFLNDSKGALLLEPTRTNLITYSEAFDNAYWTKTGSSVVSGFTSPKGDLSAFKLVEDTSTGNHATTRADFGAGVDLAQYTLSVFAKKGENDLLVVQDGTTGSNAYFNLTNGVVDGITGTGTANIKVLLDDWYHCSFTFTQSGVNLRPQIALSDTTLNGYFPSYTGNGTSGIYIWGAQLEQASYATSYIPTQGSVVTRDAESCNGAGNEQVFNGSEGVLFVEMSALANDSTTRRVNLRNSSGSNQVRIEFGNSSNLISGVLFNGANQAVINNTSNNILNSNKIAFKYKENDFALWINGVKVGTDISGATIGAGILDRIDLSLSPNQTYSNIKQIKYFNTALTDLQLYNITK